MKNATAITTQLNNLPNSTNAQISKYTLHRYGTQIQRDKLIHAYTHTHKKKMTPPKKLVLDVPSLLF